MSTILWDWPLASADGLLTNEECSMLLDVDFLENDDVLKSFPHVAPKIAAELAPLDFQLDDASATLYPPSPPSPREAKPSRAQLASDLLQQLDNQCKQENLFSNWLEEKVELPIFDNVCPERAETAPLAGAPLAAPVLLPLQLPAPAPAPAPAAVATEDLLREFECVYGAVELTHLTPPQSPPGPATQLLLSYVHAAAPAPVAAPPPASWPAHDLDELVRCRAEQLASPPPSASAGSSPLSSPRSSHSSHSSGDEDWSGSSSRGKPYARQPDERRSRKKEQNKNAATRYRQKKKAEVEVLLGEEAALRARRADLGSKCSDLQREVRYLKGLMRDLFKAKGLIK